MLERRDPSPMHHRLVPMLMLVACTAPAPEPDAIELPAEVEPESAGVAQVPEMEVVPASDSPQRRSGPLDVTPRRAGDGVLPDRPRARLDAEIGSMMDSIEMFGWTPD